MKYSQLLHLWLRACVKPSVKPRTFSRYEIAVKHHIEPSLGSDEVNSLTPLAVQRFVNGLLESGNLKRNGGLSANTVNVIITVLKKSLDYAVLAGEANENPAAHVVRPRRREKQVECFTLTEQKKIEAAVKNSGKDKLFGITLCLYTGLRVGELLALEWKDIDLVKSELSVTKSCHDSPLGIITDEPKTPSSVRVIPLPKQLLPLLKALKKNSRSPRVISNGGKDVCVRSYQRSFELLLKKLGLPRRGIHSLRHTFATRALECGMDVKTLSEILGHKNPMVTLNRYAHSLTEHKRAMMDRLGKLL
ncbi:MAG: site-specific integrase [Clostridia bacterium]|nr:site-specific integrase [Clostridia bacterium]